MNQLPIPIWLINWFITWLVNWSLFVCLHGSLHISLLACLPAWWMDGSIDRSINRSISWLVNGLMDRFIGRSVDESINGLIDWWINGSINWSINEPIDWWIDVRLPDYLTGWLNAWIVNWLIIAWNICMRTCLCKRLCLPDIPKSAAGPRKTCQILQFSAEGYANICSSVQKGMTKSAAELTHTYSWVAMDVAQSTAECSKAYAADYSVCQNSQLGEKGIPKSAAECNTSSTAECWGYARNLQLSPVGYDEICSWVQKGMLKSADVAKRWKRQISGSGTWLCST